MYQWTPLRHTHAIGAWPAQRSPSRLSVNIFRSAGGRSYRPAKQKEIAIRQVDSSPRGPPAEHHHDLSTESPTENPPAQQPLEETDDNESDERGAIAHSRANRKYRRKHGDPDLPLPPFMWPNPGLREQLRANQTRRRNLRKEEEQNYSGVILEDDPRKIKARIKKRDKPFSFAFSRNPYAHALATPVREDCFTKVHLPRACLIGFSPVESVEPNGRSRVSNYPAALAASVIAKKKNMRSLSEDEIELKAAANVDTTSFRQSGPSSYVLGLRDAIEFVAEDTRKRVADFATSRRAFEYVRQNFDSSTKLEWDEEVPALILSRLRENIRKRLAYFLRTKINKDNIGAIQAMPGHKEGLDRLDDIPDVSAVLRLKPEAQDVYGEVHGHEREDESDGPEMIRVSFKSSDPQSLAETDKEAANEGMLPADGEAETDDSASKDERIYWRQRMAWWREQESFLRDLGPAPPPAKPSTIYFPTMRYRNTRVAAYNMPYLLGEDVMAEMVKNTVFTENEYVALQNAATTVPLQYWLVQLAAYMGRRKEHTPPV